MLLNPKKAVFRGDLQNDEITSSYPNKNAKGKGCFLVLKK